MADLWTGLSNSLREELTAQAVQIARSIAVARPAAQIERFPGLAPSAANPRSR
jgi:hypothetical protein